MFLLTGIQRDAELVKSSLAHDLNQSSSVFRIHAYPALSKIMDQRFPMT